MLYVCTILPEEDRDPRPAPKWRVRWPMIHIHLWYSGEKLEISGLKKSKQVIVIKTIADKWDTST